MRYVLLQLAMQVYAPAAGPGDLVEIAHMWEHYILDGICGDLVTDDDDTLTPTGTMQ